MKISIFFFYFSIMISAMYFPVKDYLFRNEISSKEANIRACIERKAYRYPEPLNGKTISINEAMKVQSKCYKMYQEGIRHLEFERVPGFVDTPLMKSLRKRNEDSDNYCDKKFPLISLKDSFFEKFKENSHAQKVCKDGFEPTIDSLFAKSLKELKIYAGQN